MIRALIILILTALPCAAQQTGLETIVAGLSRNAVSITANFNGSEILIYGAVKRETPAPDGPPLEVIVTVEGPAAQQIVRRKDRRFGIWINNAAVTVDSAPTFYAISASGPLNAILSQTEDLRHRISVPRVVRAIGTTAEAEGAPEFLDAMLRIRAEEGRYRLAEGAVELVEDTLFRADVDLPANLTEGQYMVRIYLTRDGQVIDWLASPIDVRKAGLERWLFALAHSQPLIYGLLSLVLAVGAGWGASAGFQLLRR
ncbi:TIGR02186 family protein [Paracoccaceae bacterium Fryx2]|nr:TIGR02186 family protein [Paracoccaceae bacterium Fryx2]